MRWARRTLTWLGVAALLLAGFLLVRMLERALL